MPLSALARAKVNLCLHVTGQRPDGYHLLDSIVVFPALGDHLTIEPASTLSLTTGGPFGWDLPAARDNLVLRAVQSVGAGGAALHLEKNLPVASGIGGGSSDAATAISLAAELWGTAPPDQATLLSLGADVPVCMTARPTRMRGIGDRLEPLAALPPFWMVLVNPGVGVSTPAVFQALETKHNPAIAPLPETFESFDAFVGWLAAQRNDLESAASTLCPQIAEALSALTSSSGAYVPRMSGSGATCFAIFETQNAALEAAQNIRQIHPKWWVAAAPVDSD